MAELIASRYPEWKPDDPICEEDLNRFRYEYVHGLLESERGELSSLERAVLTSLQEHELMAKDVEAALEGRRSRSERLADLIARFGGSWAFISIFLCALLGWVLLNSLHVLHNPFDPFPYILLNLLLSCLAAIQAPVILMSQNRQDAKDRSRAQNDYQVNLKAELEIRHLHEKIDHLLLQQWERLSTIQEVQLDLLAELARR